MLGEEVLDLGDAGAGPVLEPGVGEVVLDAMEAAFAHAGNDRHGARRSPWAVRLNLPAMRTHSFLVINPRSGRGSAGRRRARSRPRARPGIERISSDNGEDPGEVARASGAEILGVAGGDGSLAAVAEAALELDAAFVCVPFGTRNHFARDLGLDRGDPLAALAAFADGIERRDRRRPRRRPAVPQQRLVRRSTPASSTSASVTAAAARRSHEHARCSASRATATRCMRA